MTIQEQLKEYIKGALSQTYSLEMEDVQVEHPENSVFGDFSTNLPLVVSSKVRQAPMEIAKNLLYKLEQSPLYGEYRGKKVKILEKVEIAPPGFINFTLTTEWLHILLENVITIGENYGVGEILDTKNVIVEYTDPNPFKVFHIGHLMTNCIGEAIGRIYESQKANVKRANYQGDVGMHVAKSLWGMQKLLEEENTSLSKIAELSLNERMRFLGRAYASGAAFYSSSETNGQVIKDLNMKVYYIAQQHLVEQEGWTPMVDYLPFIKELNDSEMSRLGEFYKLGRAWSLEYFELLYKRLGTKFDYYFFESVVGEMGLRIVQNYCEKGIFEKSDGAIVFRGENYGLHTRVFVNSEGLPVYEAKDLGLAFLKYEHFIYDRSVIVTANEVNDYFRVVIKAMEQINPELAEKTLHVGHGMMRSKTGKMSSRTGEVISGVELLDGLKKKVSEKMSDTASSSAVPVEERDETADKIAVAAAKYAILKNGIGTDIMYDEEEALSISGNTGPYILYTYTRANSVIEKGDVTDPFSLLSFSPEEYSLNEQELTLLRFIYRYPEYVAEAAKRTAPNVVSGFIYDLSQKYNLFYSQVPILSTDLKERNLRLAISWAVRQVLHNGLNLLGIPVVDKM